MHIERIKGKLGLKYYDKIAPDVEVLLGENERLRAQRDDLRLKLRHLLIDPTPLTPTQLENLQGLLAKESK